MSCVILWKNYVAIMNDNDWIKNFIAFYLEENVTPCYNIYIYIYIYIYKTWYNFIFFNILNCKYN